MCAATIESISVAGMVDRAIDFGTRRMGLPGRGAALAALQKGDCTLCESLRYALARETAQYLGAMDGTLKAVYIYDPDNAAAAEDAISSPGINLIAWVERKSAALSAMIGLLGMGLAEEYGRIACPKADALCWALDVQVVDDGEVKSRSGYGALISSLYVRPLEVWRR